MKLRSLLFVPGDRPERFDKAAASGADAIILDLADSVSPANKDAARHAVAEYLAGAREVVTLVRINPLDGPYTLDDLVALRALTEIGLEGAIVGKALYSGAFTLDEALRVARD